MWRMKKDPILIATNLFPISRTALRVLKISISRVLPNKPFNKLKISRFWTLFASKILLKRLFNKINSKIVSCNFKTQFSHMKPHQKDKVTT